MCNPVRSEPLDTSTLQWHTFSSCWFQLSQESDNKHLRFHQSVLSTAGFSPRVPSYVWVYISALGSDSSPGRFLTKKQELVPADAKPYECHCRLDMSGFRFAVRTTNQQAVGAIPSELRVDCSMDVPS